MAQGPSEMEQVGPAKPGWHAHMAAVVLQVPPLRQAAFAEQPDTPHVRTASGASPSSRVHSCAGHQEFLVEIWSFPGVARSVPRITIPSAA